MLIVYTKFWTPAQPSEGHGAGLETPACVRLLDDAPHTRPGAYLQAASGLRPSFRNGSQWRPALALEYSSIMGLSNQQYSHISAMGMAIALGADTLIVPPASTRVAFADRFYEQTWQPVPLASLWDMACWRAYAAARGITIIEAPAAPQLEKIGYPVFNPLHLHDDQVVTIPLQLFQMLTMPGLVRFVIRHVSKHMDRRGLQTKLPGRILLKPDVVCASLKVSGSPLMSEIAMNLIYAPALHQIADRLIGKARSKSSSGRYNGLHLRMEADSAYWAFAQNGTGAVWQRYRHAIKASAFDTKTPLWVASGIFQNVTRDMQKKLRMLRQLGASEILEKTQPAFLGPTELDLEALAVIDFLVLAQANALVLYDASSFSLWLESFRVLNSIEGPEPVFLLGLRRGVPSVWWQGAEHGLMFDRWPVGPGLRVAAQAAWDAEATAPFTVTHNLLKSQSPLLAAFIKKEGQ